jgi:amino acid adenylation domain-containing protein
MVRRQLNDGPAPLSSAQERLFLLDQLMPGLPVYNVPRLMRVGTTLDSNLLRDALNAIISRHEILRTSLHLLDGVPVQQVTPFAEVELTVVDLRSRSHSEREPEGARILGDLACRSFDLASDVLLRAGLVHLRRDEDLLMIVLHHIASDHASGGLLFAELDQLYASLQDGTEPLLPDLPIQYSDFARWQRDQQAGHELDELLDYWTERLAGAPALLELPTDRPRPRVQSYRGGRCEFALAPAQVAPLQHLARSHRASLFMVLLATFKVLIHRYTGAQDVVLGSPVSGRLHEEIDSLLGFFTNTLALRTNLSGDPSFAELLARVKQTTLEARAHQELPFEKLVEVLNPERSQSHEPIFQVLFGFDVVPGGRELAGCTLEALPLPAWQWSRFDLTIVLREGADGSLRAHLEYSTDLFDASTIERLIAHYQTLLEAVADGPEQRLSELPMLAERERRRLLIEFNDCDALYPRSCVHELVTQQASRTPEAIAVRHGDQQLSYAQLDARANQLAHHLVDLGVAPDVLVGICVERSLEMVIALLGILKAGGAYVPIDPAYPEERVAFMLADTDSPVLLTQQHLLAGLPNHRARTVCLDADPDLDLINAHDDGPVSSATTLEQLAYVIYTSGSTGRPKGVAMGHRPLANLLAWQLESFSTPVAARTLQFASLSFDVAFQEIFSTWCSGGTLVLIDEATRRDPEALLTCVSEQRVERLFLPFVALQNVCEAAGHLGASIPSLREVITAGEQLKATDAVRGFFAAHANCALVNQYGPTESHVVTAFTLADDSEQWPALPPIGRPIANAKVYVLDGHRQPVPIGVPGELYIGGVSLARGYLNRPELTSERFVEDPFAFGSTERLYRTGDLVRWREPGTLEFLGRSDHQMKIRGFRIEPGEIEATLREHPDVREALVVAREDDAVGKRLVAYVIGESPAASPEDLRDLLRRTLPDYMIPSAFVFLDAFPLSPNGKVDRAALPAPSGEGRASSEYSPPQTDTERRLAEIWSRVLDIEDIGVNDNFFALGGHSLMAVRLFAQIERRLSVRLPLSALFENATIAGLAELLEREQAVDTVEWPSLVQLRAGAGQPPLFLIGWADGEVLPWRELVENLQAGLPVFGLRAPGVDRFTLPLASVEELAAHYVKEVRGAQPHGPYRLGGFCFSGLVAYEMARLLREEGEDLGLLALIDAYPKQPSQQDRRFEHARSRLGEFKDADLRGKGAWVASHVAGLPGAGRWAVWQAAYEKLGPRVFELLESRNLQHLIPRRPLNLVYIASNLARKRYVPRPVDVRVEFFRAQTAPDARPTPWEALATKGVELRQIVAVDIDHERMMHEPRVQLLAAELTRALDKPSPHAFTRLDHASSITQFESTCSGESRTTARGASSSSGP